MARNPGTARQSLPASARSNPRTPEARSVHAWLRAAAPFLVIAASVLVAFGRTVIVRPYAGVPAGFVDWDDNVNVYQNLALIAPSWSRFVRLWTQPYAELYVPLVYTTYLLDLFVGRGSAAMLHLTNLILHTLAASTVYLLLVRLLQGCESMSSGSPRALHCAKPGSAGSPPFSLRAAALVGALLFAVHPMQVEPVAWATGRKDVMSGTLLLLAIYQFDRWLEQPRLRVYLWASVCLLGALLSKPSAIVAPLLGLALLEFRRADWRRALPALAPWCVLSAVWVLITMSAQSEKLADAPFEVIWWKRPLIMADSFLFYISKIFVPRGLAPIYPRTTKTVLASPFAWPQLLVFAAGCVVLLRRHGRLRLAALLFMIPLLPVSGLMTFIYQHFSNVADRYCYVSFLGAGLMAALALSLVQRRLPVRATHMVLAACAVGLACCAALSFRQAGFWQNSETLWYRELAIDFSNTHAHYNLARTYADQRRWADAEAQYKTIIQIDPLYARAYTDRMVLARNQGRQAEAQQIAREALRLLPPNWVEAFVARGTAHLELGQFAEAAESYRGAIAGAPEDADCWNNLGISLFKLARHYQSQGALDQANRSLIGSEQALRKAVAINETMPSPHANLGNTLALMNKLPEAAEHLRLAVQLDPYDELSKSRLHIIEQAIASGKGAAPPQ